MKKLLLIIGLIFFVNGSVFSETNKLKFLEDLIEDDKKLEEDKKIEEYIYNNCILKKIKSGMSNGAALLIKRSCEYKSRNPSWLDTKYYEWFVK